MASPHLAPVVPRSSPPATRASVPVSPAPVRRGRSATLQRFAPRLATTPGRLTAWLVTLLVLAFVTAVTGAYDVRDRTALLDDVTSRSGPLTITALEIYQSLSEADAIAASAFLTGGHEPQQLRERYETSIARATSALATAAAGASRRPSLTAVAELNGNLPIYTGLVETARTYNRMGLPIGAAYLREASGLMRQRLLPAAQRLYKSEIGGLAAAQDRAAELPWLAVTVAVVTFAALVYAQRFLTRRTNRVFNVGLLLATVATVAAVAWLAVTTTVAARHAADSRSSSSVEVALLAEARIAASQARSDEALTLVARGNGPEFEEHYAATMKRLLGEGQGTDEGLLNEARARTTDPATRATIDDAIAVAQRWRQEHQRLRKLDDDGQYNDAVALAIGTDAESTASLSRRLDEHLARAVAQANDRFSQRASRARNALCGADVAVVVLLLVAALTATMGLQRRIMEYR